MKLLSRVRQELVNIALSAHPPAPKFDADFTPRLPLPDASQVACLLRRSKFAPEIVATAEQICSHEFPLLGWVVETGPDIRWRRDYLRGLETRLCYFRRIPYLDTERAGDHKIIWELNRHQHLVVLAEAYLLTGDTRKLTEIWAELESWIAGNPFHRGTNWASALEVAFRSLSWIWIDHLVGRDMPSDLRVHWLHMLYLHGCHLRNNLSFYFSPNNHLVGEALVLHALGRYFAGVPRAGDWERTGAQVMQEQLDRQVQPDGSSFEQSTYYQGYLLDMFTLHAVLRPPDACYFTKLQRMAEFSEAVTGPSGLAPMLGDDDGGLLPLGALMRPRVAGICQSRLFPDSGVAVMVDGDTHAVVDAGPFGARNSGHSHSDTLSIVIRRGGEEILIDPGTYTYTGEPEWRDWFRSTAAHNTVRIDACDQGVMAGPFRWTKQPKVAILNWRTSSESDVLLAECCYAGFTHRRRVEFLKPHLFVITDEINGPRGEHDVEQFWHLGSLEARSKLVLPPDAGLTDSWRSTTFGEKHTAPMLRVHRRGKLPMCLEARIDLSR